jgi:hypothetical protein
MLKRSLTLLALTGLFAPLAPLSAQDAHVFSYDRPDAQTFGAVLGDRILPEGQILVGYAFEQADYEDIFFGSDRIEAPTVFGLYTLSPFDRLDRRHTLQFSYGVTDYLTLRAAGVFVDYSRDVVAETGNPGELLLASTSNDGIGDIDIEGMVRLYESDSFLAHAGLGLEFPTGDYDATDFNLATSTQTRLPYNMQRGSGSTSLVPGITMATQNEHGTVGVQVRTRLRLNNGSFGWRAGNEVEGKLWAGYRINDVLALTTGVRALSFGSIDGFDETLDPTRDPAEDVILSGGTIVSAPIGVNVLLDQGFLEGNMFSFEFDWTIHQEYDNVRLGLDRVFRITWSKPYDL